MKPTTVEAAREMKVVVNLTEKELKILRDRQIFPMQWIQAGMDEKEPFDLIIQKILNASEEENKSE